MIDLDANPGLRRLYRIARLRVSLGFAVAALAFWLATPTWTSLAAGALVGALGEGIRVWAAGHLRKGREVTTSGPYRFVRHPLYVGSLLLGTGFSVAAASVPSALVVMGYLLLMLGVAARLEEATLREDFGPAYDRYASGAAPGSERTFSWAQARQNGEHLALLGFAASLGVLALKVI